LHGTLLVVSCGVQVRTDVRTEVMNNAPDFDRQWTVSFRTTAVAFHEASYKKNMPFNDNAGRLGYYTTLSL